MIVVLLVAALVGGGLGAAFATGAIGGSSAGTGPLTVGTDVKLAVTPQQGGCDTTFNFEATGSLSGTGTLVYRWERSDGQQTADIPVAITANEGSFRFTMPWRILGKQKLDAQMTFRIVSPTQRTASRAISYNCA
jgi:hypothetical protein